MLFKLRWISSCFCLLPAMAGLFAQAAPMTVGVTPSPPFSMEGEDGQWEGLSVDLWRALAEDLGIEYELRPVDLAEALQGLEGGELDVVAAALTVNAERERVMDFSHAFHDAGLSIATPVRERSAFLAFLRSLFSWEFALALGALGVLLLGVGALVWLAERKANPEQFGGDPVRGLGSGFWWSAVTMTTVGYGDKAPLSFAGRIVGLVWMFASIVVISGFTGALASALTVSGLTPAVSGLEDLYRVKTGVVADSTGAEFLESQGIRYREYGDTEEGLAAVAAGELEAFVHDAPVLRYYVSREYPADLTVVAQTFDPGFYALGLREDHPDLREINLALLDRLQSGEWQQLRMRYLGSE